MRLVEEEVWRPLPNYQKHEGPLPARRFGYFYDATNSF